MKRQTSVWAKQRDPAWREFAWQGGYGAFSVSQSQSDVVTRYIRDQERHHRRATFQDEYRRILQLNRIDWDEAYVRG